MSDSALPIPHSAFANPYVGPRPFEENERLLFFGRREETRQLAALVIAQRVVIFHAPSGAGKTSLLRASLVPLLQELKKIVVLPSSRVSGDLPSDVDPGAVKNIYVFNALIVLYGQTAKAHELAGLSLREGLQPFLAPQEGETRSRPRLLIIDQFEELFTTHIERHPERADFFRQLQACLATYPQLSLLLAMREDYIANLDFYAAQLPDRLRTRFRIERLSEKDALEAVKGPAAAAGRSFDAGVAEALVDNLRRVQLGQPDNEMPRVTVALGTYIEPVHLQIVCRQLWENLPPERSLILAEDVQKFGDVDQALIGFYENTLQTVIAQTGISQRRLRNWFNEELITLARTRGLVYQGEEGTAGLANDAVNVLNNAYIIRADIRGNDTWYELAHDRLVEPILAANAAWQARYTNPLALPTQAWLQNGRDPTRLLQGDRLAEAQAYAQDHPDELLPDEQEFLADSLRQQALADEQTRQVAQRRRNLAIAAVVVIIALTTLTLWALGNAAAARTQEAIADDQRATAEEQARIASSRELASAAVSNLATDPELSILLALHALSTSHTIQAEQALHQAVQASRIQLTLYGHTGAVNGVAVSPDGKLLATAGADGAVKVWDAASGDEVATVGQPGAPVNTVAFSPNGKWLAAAGDDGYTRLWAVTQGMIASQPVTLAGQNVRIARLAFSPDSTRLATSGYEGMIWTWIVADTSLGQPMQVITDTTYQSISEAIAFSRDGSRLATGRADGSIVIWGVASRRKLLEIPGDTGRVYGIAFSPDARKLATAALHGVKLWDSATGEELQRFAGHTAEVVAVAFNADGSRLATASNDQRVKIWDVASGQELFTLAGHKRAVLDVAFVPTSDRIVTASADGTARLWNAGPIHELVTLVDSNDRITDIVFVPDGRHLTSQGEDGTVRIWDWMAARTVVSYTIFPPQQVGASSFSEDGRRLASGIKIELPSVWDIEASLTAGAGRRLLTLSEDKGQAYFIVALNFAGTRLATSAEDKTIKLWDTATGERLQTLPAHPAIVRSFAFSRDSTRLASASTDDPTIRVWDAITASPLITLTGHSDEVRDLAFSPDDHALASAGADGIAIIWDMQSAPELGKERLRLAGHTAPLSSIAFSPDGTRLATSSGDKTAKIWNAATRQELLTLGGDQAALLMAVFSPDGRHLATLSVTGTVRVYTLAVQELIDLARNRVTRPLTREECSKYLHFDNCPPIQ